MKRLPKAIQIFFTDDRNGNELAHDYYLNAAWVTELCDRYGALNVGRFIYRSVEAKRKACIKRYGSEWGREKKILEKKKKRASRRRKNDGDTVNTKQTPPRLQKCP